MYCINTENVDPEYIKSAYSHMYVESGIVSGKESRTL